ncbi:MAG TPA: phage holin family protein [Gammaproteobacteria bacterium]|jgi:uncharacterized membrane protein YqjE
MIEEGIAAQPGPVHGVLVSAKNFVATLIAIIGTRLEIAASELEEERLRLSEMMAWGACAMLFGALALIFFSLLLVAVFWDDHRLLVLGLITATYLILAAVASLKFRKCLEQKSKLFAVTIEELRKDQEGLRS